MSAPSPKVSLTATVGRNVASHLVARLLEAVLLLVTLPLVIRVLGPERYGVFSLGLITLLYLTVLEFGVSQAQVALLSKDRALENPRSMEALLGSSIAVYAGAALAGGLVVALLAPLAIGKLFQVPAELVPEATHVFRLVGASLFLQLVQSTFRAVLTSFHRVSVVNWAPLSASVITFPAMKTPSSARWAMAGLSEPMTGKATVSAGR